MQLQRAMYKTHDQGGQSLMWLSMVVFRLRFLGVSDGSCSSGSDSESECSWAGSSWGLRGRHLALKKQRISLILRNCVRKQLQMITKARMQQQSMRMMKPLSSATIVNAPSSVSMPSCSISAVRFVKMRANGCEKTPVCAKFSVRLVEMQQFWRCRQRPTPTWKGLVTVKPGQVLEQAEEEMLQVVLSCEQELSKKRVVTKAERADEKSRSLIWCSTQFSCSRISASLSGLGCRVKYISVTSSLDSESSDSTAMPCVWRVVKLSICATNCWLKKKRQVRCTSSPRAVIAPIVQTISRLRMASLGFFRFLKSVPPARRFCVSTSKFLRAISTAYFIFSALSWSMRASESEMYMRSVSFSRARRLLFTQQSTMKKQRSRMMPMELQRTTPLRKLRLSMLPAIESRMAAWFEEIISESCPTQVRRISRTIRRSPVNITSVTWASTTSTSSERVPIMVRFWKLMLYCVLSKMLTFLRAWMRAQDSLISAEGAKAGQRAARPDSWSRRMARMRWKSMLKASMFWQREKYSPTVAASAWNCTISATDSAMRVSPSRMTARKMQHSSEDCSLTSFFLASFTCSSNISLQPSRSSRSTLQRSPSQSRQVLMSDPSRSFLMVAAADCSRSKFSSVRVWLGRRQTGSLQPKIFRRSPVSSSEQWNSNLLLSFLSWKLRRFCRMLSLRSLLSLETMICANSRCCPSAAQFSFFTMIRQPLWSVCTLAIFVLSSFSRWSAMQRAKKFAQSMVSDSLRNCPSLILLWGCSMSWMRKSLSTRKRFLRVEKGSLTTCTTTSFFCLMQRSCTVTRPHVNCPSAFFRKLYTGSSSACPSARVSRFRRASTETGGKRMSVMLRYLSSKRVHCRNFCASELAFSRLPVSGQSVRVGRQFSAMSSKCICCCTFMRRLTLSRSITSSLTKLVKNSRQSSIILKLMRRVLSSSEQTSLSRSTFRRMLMPTATMLSILGCVRASSSQKEEQCELISKMRSQKTFEITFLLDSVDFMVASLSLVSRSIEYRMQSCFSVSGLSTKHSTSDLCPSYSPHSSLSSRLLSDSFLRPAISCPTCSSIASSFSADAVGVSRQGAARQWMRCRLKMFLQFFLLPALISSVLNSSLKLQQKLQNCSGGESQGGRKMRSFRLRQNSIPMKTTTDPSARIHRQSPKYSFPSSREAMAARSVAAMPQQVVRSMRRSMRLMQPLSMRRRKQATARLRKQTEMVVPLNEMKQLLKARKASAQTWISLLRFHTEFFLRSIRIQNFSETSTTITATLISRKVIMLRARLPAPCGPLPACVKQYAAKLTRGTRKYSTILTKKLSNLEQKVKTELKTKCRTVSRVTKKTKTSTTMVTMVALMPKPLTRLVRRKMRRIEETEAGKTLGEAKRTETQGKMMARCTMIRQSGFTDSKEMLISLVTEYSLFFASRHRSTVSMFLISIFKNIISLRKFAILYNQVGLQVESSNQQAANCEVCHRYHVEKLIQKSSKEVPAVGTVRLHLSPSFDAGVVEDVHIGARQHHYFFVHCYALEAD